MKPLTTKIIILLSVILFVIFYFIPAFQGQRIVNAQINLFGLKIHYYGLALSLGIFVSFLVALKFADRIGVARHKVEKFLPILIVAGLVGARLYFVLFSWDYFSVNLSQIPQFWKGGLSIYGALIGGAVAMWTACKIYKEPIGNSFDLAALCLPVGQAIGRFGNFFNQEAFGRPTNLPWKMYVSPRFRPAEFLEQRYFHPTFLYEALWNILIFVVLWSMIKRYPDYKRGLLFAVYLVCYSAGRFFIEGLRLDSFYLAGFRVDQITALLAAVFGAIITYLIYGKNYSEKHI